MAPWQNPNLHFLIIRPDVISRKLGTYLYLAVAAEFLLMIIGEINHIIEIQINNHML